MTAKPVIIDATCPGCKKDHAIAVPIDDLNIAMGHVHNDAPTTELDAMKVKSLVAEVIEEHETKKSKKKEEEEQKKPPQVETVYPFWQPGEFCADGSCGAAHKNKNYREKPAKKCTNCGQYAPKKAAKCAWCKESDKLDAEDRFEDLDEDDLEDLKFEPIEAEHPHEH